MLVSETTRLVEPVENSALYINIPPPRWVGQGFENAQWVRNLPKSIVIPQSTKGRGNGGLSPEVAVL